MKRTHEQTWYIGRFIRLTCDVETRKGITYGEGRVFRVSSVHRGWLSVGPPAIGVLGTLDAPMIRKLDFEHVEILPGFTEGEADTCRPVETGFCRVCGCVDGAGCPPDDDGESCWWSDESNQTLCSRCVPALIVAGKRSHVFPVPFLIRTLDWCCDRADMWLGGYAGHVKLDGIGYWVWRRETVATTANDER